MFEAEMDDDSINLPCEVKYSSKWGVSNQRVNFIWVNSTVTSKMQPSFLALCLISSDKKVIFNYSICFLKRPIVTYLLVLL